MKKQLLLPMLLILAAAPPFAQDYNAEITPFGGYRFGGNFDIEETGAGIGSATSVELSDSSSYGLMVDWRHSPNTTWQILYSEQDTDAQVSGTATPLRSIGTQLRVLQIGGTYRGPGDVVQPYLAATVGGTHIRTSGNESQSDTFFSGSIGVGINVLPTSRFGLRLEARAYGTLTDSSTDLFCQTGPDLNVCAIRVQGKLLSQVETFAGFTFRF